MGLGSGPRPRPRPRPRLAGSRNSRSLKKTHVPVSRKRNWHETGHRPVRHRTPLRSRSRLVLACSASVPACPFVDPIGFPDPLPPPIPRRRRAGHVQVRHHPHHLLRWRRGAPRPRRRLPARLHLPGQGPGRLGAGDAAALARARGRPRRRPAPEPGRRVPPRARQPRPLRHELRHRRPRRRLPLPPLAPGLPHRLPRLHARLARPLLPPRRAPRPPRPRRRRRLRPRRARHRHARPPPPHRRHRQYPLLAARRPRPRPPARRAAQGGGQRRRRGRPLVRAGATAAVALGSECGYPVLDNLFSKYSSSCASWAIPISSATKGLSLLIVVHLLPVPLEVLDPTTTMRGR